MGKFETIEQASTTKVQTEGQFQGRYTLPSTVEELKRLLYLYPELQERVNRITENIKQVQEEADSFRDVSSPVYDGFPKSTKKPDTTAIKTVILERYGKRIAKYLKDVDEINCLRYTLDDALEGLTDEEFGIVKERYFKGLSWDRVSRSTYTRKANCLELHDSAMAHLEKVLNLYQRELPGTDGN